MSGSGTDFGFVTVGAIDGPHCAERVLDDLEGALRVDGWQLADLLAFRVFYTRQDLYAPFSAERGPRFRAAFGEVGFPATTGLVTTSRPGGAAIEIEALASRQRSTANSSRVYSTFPSATMRPAFSHLAARDDLVVLSGQTGFDVTGGHIAESVLEQATASLDNLRAVLEDSGNSEATLTLLRVYVTDAAFIEEVAREIDRFIRHLAQPAPPAVVTLVVEALFKQGVFVEIEAIGAPAGVDSSWALATGRSQPGTDAGVVAIEQAFGDVEQSLESAGLTLEDALTCTTWLAAQDVGSGVNDQVAMRLRLQQAAIQPVIVRMKPHGGAGGAALVEVAARRRL